MFPLKNFREHITNKLDTDITVFRKFRETDGILKIEETNIDRKDSTQLSVVKIKNLPTSDVWIFENEFGDKQIKDNTILDKQKRAFSNAGNKVEKTIVWHNNDRLYLIMFEMKRSMTFNNFSDISKKLEHSLSFISIFIAAHAELPSNSTSSILPIGVCCFNLDETSTLKEASEMSPSRKTLKREYVDAGKKQFSLTVQPLTLNNMRIPIIFYENPIPDTNNFDIDFHDIIHRVSLI